MVRRPRHPLAKSAAAALGLATGAYAGYVASTWLRYGHPAPTRQADPLLDRFMPTFDVAERHQVHVDAPADVTLAAASELDLEDSAVARAVFRGRELLLGSARDAVPRPRGLLALTKSLGWGVLAEVPGREVVMGAVTKPWEADVVFQPLAPHAFAAFNEPAYVKIAWTLRADPIDAFRSTFRSETRAVATDATARRKFRRYWSLLSPGIILIRWASLDPIKREAERRARR